MPDHHRLGSAQRTPPGSGAHPEPEQLGGAARHQHHAGGLRLRHHARRQAGDRSQLRRIGRAHVRRAGEDQRRFRRRDPGGCTGMAHPRGVQGRSQPRTPPARGDRPLQLGHQFERRRAQCHHHVQAQKGGPAGRTGRSDRQAAGLGADQGRHPCRRLGSAALDRPSPQHVGVVGELREHGELG